MDTALQKFKKIKNFVIHNLESEDTGYGSYGGYTRKGWRDICIQKFNSGQASFRAWQNELKNSMPISHEVVDFGYTVNCADGSSYTSTPLLMARFTIDFTGHEFNTPVNAAGYQFLMPVTFNASTFSSVSIFDSAVFSSEAWFETVLFTGKANFNKTKFNGSVVCFNSSRFLDIANFVQTEFSCLTLFKETVFDKRINFESASFATVGHFEGANFLTRIPNFSGASKSSTELVFDDKSYFPIQVVDTEDIAYLGVLKRLADEHGQTDQALNFNAMELKSKLTQKRWKIKDISFIKKIVNTDYWYTKSTELYDTYSDFGRSFTRPLLAYGVLMLVTLVLALGHGLWASMDACEREGWNVYEQLYRDQVSCPVVATVGEKKIPLSVPRAAFEYTAYRASGVLDFADSDKQTMAVAERLFGQSIEPWWMRIWGVFKAIASTALLFLAALGLRNKYRIK